MTQKNIRGVPFKAYWFFRCKQIWRTSAFVRFNSYPVGLPTTAAEVEANMKRFSTFSPLLLLPVPSFSVVDVAAATVDTWRPDPTCDAPSIGHKNGCGPSPSPPPSPSRKPPASPAPAPPEQCPNKIRQMRRSRQRGRRRRRGGGGGVEPEGGGGGRQRASRRSR